MLSIHKIKMLMKILFPTKTSSYATMQRRWQGNPPVFVHNVTLDKCIQYFLQCNYICRSRASREMNESCYLLSNDTEFIQTFKYLDLVKDHKTYSEEMLFEIKTFVSRWYREKGGPAILEFDPVIKLFPDILDKNHCKIIFKNIFKLPMSSGHFLARDFYPYHTLPPLPAVKDHSTEDTESESGSSADSERSAAVDWDTESVESDYKWLEDNEKTEETDKKEEHVEVVNSTPSTPFSTCVPSFSFFSPSSVISQSVAAVQKDTMELNENIERDCLTRLIKLYYRDHDEQGRSELMMLLRRQLTKVFEDNVQVFPYAKGVVESCLFGNHLNKVEMSLKE